jgi:glycine/D-amino acid oxidase-like deaminating enzyme
LGGEGKQVGNADDSTLDPRPSAAIREFLGNCFHGEEVVVQREWAGVMGFTRDGLPLVGPVAGRRNVFLAAGYNGHGMPRAFRAARAVARMIKGDGDDERLLNGDCF